MVLHTKNLAEENKKLVIDSNKRNEREEKQFVGQNKPLIEVTPIGISQITKDLSITFFSILNYSGFKAYNIAIDIKFGEGNSWLGEWEKAYEDRIKKENKNGVIKHHIYSTEQDSPIKKLCPGQSIVKKCKRDHPYVIGCRNCLINKKRYFVDCTSEHKKKIMAFNKCLLCCDYHPKAIGSVQLEEICDSNSKCKTAFVRVTWKNENGHVFDEIHQYKLICTIDTDTKDPNAGRGRSFTFIPEGIISHKGKK